MKFTFLHYTPSTQKNNVKHNWFRIYVKWGISKGADYQKGGIREGWCVIDKASWLGFIVLEGWSLNCKYFKLQFGGLQKLHVGVMQYGVQCSGVLQYGAILRSINLCHTKCLPQRLNIIEIVYFHYYKTKCKSCCGFLVTDKFSFSFTSWGMAQIWGPNLGPNSAYR